ncbi:UbiA family prenyltransferase [Haloferax prahovense]|nr:UbiA family prenyltransferase [Haloferax prahovense]
MSNTVETSAGASATHTVRCFLRVNRVPETVGYNVTYVAIGVGLASRWPVDSGTTALVVLFAAVMLSKMQASVADALHDRELDAENPSKSVISNAVSQLGCEVTRTLLVTEIVVALALWGWLTHVTGTLLFLACGAAVTVLGYVYSYPPRLKERGVVNHVTTTGVDVIGIILPVVVLSGSALTPSVWATLFAVFLYGFGYHVLHQAGDTYYDREFGVTTFTQRLGVTRSVRVASVATILAGIVLCACGAVLGGAAALAVGVGYAVLAARVVGRSERAQSDAVSRWFHIGWVATFLNGSLAASLFL